MMLALVGLLRLGTLIRHAPTLHRPFQKKTQIPVFRYWSDR
jgi:hypothetical protein